MMTDVEDGASGTGIDGYRIITEDAVMWIYDPEIRYSRNVGLGNHSTASSALV